MALEDFWTLNEINNGLADPDRVKELVGLMQKGTYSIINSTSDTARQWSAVGSVIAGTENKDCILLFVQLNGLVYMNRWLKDALDFGNKTSDSCVEDTIIDLLRAVSRIVADSDKLVTSEVWVTVKDLLGHTNPKVRDMAKSLLEIQNKDKPREAVMKGDDIDKTENTERAVSETYSGANSNLEPSNGAIDASQGILTSEFRQETVEGDLLSTACKSVQDEEINKTSFDGSISNENIPYSTSSKSFPEPANDNLDKLEPHLSCSEEPPSAEACRVVCLKQDIQKEEINGFELDSTRAEKLTQKMVSSPQIHDKEKDSKATPSRSDTGTFHSATKPCDIKDDNAEEKDCGAEVSDCLKTASPLHDKKMNDDKSSGYDRTFMAVGTKGGGEHNSNMLVVSNTSGLKPKKGSGGLLQRTGNLGIIEGHTDNKVEGCLTKDYDFSKQKSRKKYHSIVSKSDFDLDYGIADPLELARLVAIEVEREVEDCRELSCSSSDKELSSKVKLPESSHSATGEQCQGESSAAEVSTQPDLSIHSPTRDDHVTCAQSTDPGSQEASSPQVTEAAEVIEASTDGGLCHFDLNQDVCLEDVEHQGDTTSPPVSVSTTREAGPLTPLGPLQFEGALGWKGSAATSAFIPPSPRRVPECLSAGGSNSSSKENLSLLNIDLNASEIGDEKQIPVSFQMASLESSVVASSRKSERLEFDLNQISDDGAPLDLQPELDLFHRRSGHHNQSSSSSSSPKQSSLRNFDLNDQPKVANGLSSTHFYPKPSQCSFASGNLKSDDSVISIMGMRVEVNRKDSSIKSVNRKIPEQTDGFNLERPGSLLAMGPPASYPHPHMFGLNGLPPGSYTPFPSPIYGSGSAIPYMVDSRGSPLAPQIMPSSVISTSFPQAPYPFSMTGIPGSNGVGLSRDNFDLDSGLCPEGSGLDPGGLRQLFNPQPRPFDERLKGNSQPSTSSDIVVGGKRKEPESVWESYPFKHQQPWR